MTESTKPIKVVIPPEVLEQMQRDIPEDELQGVLDEIKRLVESGELFENSEPVDLEALKTEDPEMYLELMEAMKAQGFDDMDDMVDGAVAIDAAKRLN